MVLNLLWNQADAFLLHVWCTCLQTTAVSSLLAADWTGWKRCWWMPGELHHLQLVPGLQALLQVAGLMKKLLNMWSSPPASCSRVFGLQAAYSISGSRLLSRDCQSTRGASVGRELFAYGDYLERSSCSEEAKWVATQISYQHSTKSSQEEIRKVTF